MSEGRIFVIKTVEAVWFFIHKSVVLGYKLPSNFRRDDIVVLGGRTGGHDDYNAILACIFNAKKDLNRQK